MTLWRLAGVTCLLTTVLNPLILRAGLVAHYDFEGGSGTTVADVTGNGHDGTLQNPDATDWVAGRVGNYALDLSGGNQYVTTANGLASDLGIGGNNPKSVAFWSYTRAFDNGGAFQVGATGNAGQMMSLRTLTAVNSWRAQFWSSPDFDVTAHESATNWTHFVLVHDGSQGRIYQNGFLIAYKNSTLNTDDNRGFEIGRYNTGEYFDGIIDDVRVYDHALSQEEVQGLAGATLDASEQVAAAFTLDWTAQTNVAGMVFEQVRSLTGGLITNIVAGEALIDGRLGPANPGGLAENLVQQTLNFGTGAHGDITPDDAWIAGDSFATRAWGVLDVPAPGLHSFAVYSDDGFRLRMGRSGHQVSMFPDGRNGKTTAAVYFSEAGLYPIEMIYFENGGGEGLEFQYWAGGDPNGTPILLNDTNAGSLAVYQNVLDADDRYTAPVSGGTEFLSARFVATNNYFVNSLYQARELLDGVIAPERDRRQALKAVNIATFNGMPADHFGGEFTGVLNVPAAGVHEFTCSSDDGFRLELGKNNTTVGELNVPKGTSDTWTKVAFLDPGLYPFRLTWFEKDGGNQVNLSIDDLTLDDGAQPIDVYPAAGPKLATQAGGMQRFVVTQYETTDTIDSSYAAWQLLRGDLTVTDTATVSLNVIDMWDTGGTGHYNNNTAFPLDTPADDNDFVVHALGYVDFPAAGFWTFGVNSDDGFVLEIGGRAVNEAAGPKGTSDILASVYIPEAGSYRLDLTYFERSGGASLELFAAQGLFQTWNATDFHLVGDTAGGGLPVYMPNGGTVFKLK